MRQYSHSVSPTRRFLIVEPDTFFRSLLRVAFSVRCSEVSAVASFDEARALLLEHPFTAIIAEYHLPGDTGLSLYSEVRCLMPQTPFVLTCGGRPVVIISDPYFRFFGKPFSVTDLVATIEQMLEETTVK